MSTSTLTKLSLAAMSAGLLLLTACSGVDDKSRSSATVTASSSIKTASSSTKASVSSLPLSSSASVSSLAAVGSPSSAPALQKTALAIIEEQCTSCHFGLHKGWGNYKTDADWLAAQTTLGVSYIDHLNPKNSLLLTRMKYYGAMNSTMPLDNAAAPEAFTRAHYDVIEAWIKSLALPDAEPVGDGSVALSNAVYSELGVSASLVCGNPDETLSISLNNPSKIARSGIGAYGGVMARASGVTTTASANLAAVADDGVVTLRGEGLDIWDKSVFFNALSSPVVNGEVDLTLDVLGVEGVAHDFAKVGLLVSSTDDLSGQLVFVHWAGKHGLAEDSGTGVLDQYRQIAANPNGTTVLTPTPARLRIAYENNTLKIGACLGCESPPMGLPKTFNFVPKRIYIVASSHAESAIQARLSLRDAYAQAGQYERLASQKVTCVDGEATVHFSPEATTGLSVLQLGVVRADETVASTRVVKAFSDGASCELQDELLAPTLRRLSESQIKNSMVAVFGDIFARDIWPSMDDGAKLIGMNAMADKLNINNLNFERLYDTVAAVSTTLLAKHTTVMNCAMASSDACVADFVRDYGKRLWRRPLTTAEVAQFTSTYTSLSGNPRKLDFAVQSLLLSAHFLFRSEIGVLVEGAQALSNYEMVSVLSYSVVNSTPDDTLLTLAAKTTPLTRAELSAQIDRLFMDPRANQAMMEVYKDYLKLDLVMSRPKEASLNFTDAVRRDVLASAEKMLESKITHNPNYMSVFGGSEYFLNNNTASLFGQTASHSDFKAVAIDSDERVGILNHPAFLSVHSTLSSSGIVKRGVFVLEQLLCQELPDPPGDVMPVPIPGGIDPERTSERELLKITHSAQAACVGCHQIIDPAGFGFENFDVIGRYRTREKNNVTIDASGVLDNVGEYVLRYDTSAQFANQLMASPQMQSCVSRRFLESFLGQEVELSACELKKYQGLLQSNGGSVKDLLTSLIQLESFGKRQ
ncbi:MAG: DUF1588 domain-containing protein [Marinagarivorans sp.]|nr:DUF1588 domain-containing protein [Marinagarivorans sp.]